MNGIEMVVDKTKLEAQELHVQIMANGQMMANALLEFAKGLKAMRDKRLYQALGYTCFEEYAEQAVGIRQRQAYNYIATFERLGEKYMAQNADLGISKLQLLAEIPANERDAFAEDNDLAGMSVAQIKAKIKEADDRGQQLSMLGAELEDAQSCERTYKAEMERLSAENAALAKQLAEQAQPKPIPAALDAEAVEEIRRQAIEETKQAEAAARQKLKDKLEKAKEKAVAEKEEAVRHAREEATRQAKEEAAAAVADQLAKQEAETAEATKRAEELAKRLELTDIEEATEFRLLFGQIQQAADRMSEIVEMMDKGGYAEQAEKLRKALCAALGALIEQMGV